jgi:hypothetical protein
MTSQTGKDRFDWRRAIVGGLASGVVAVGLMTGFGVSTAFAQPADPTETEEPTAEAAGPAPGENCTGDDCARADEGPQKVSADQVLAQIHTEYAQGDGGGQISKLIDDAMKLRAQGFKPSTANALALQDAMEHRPNQTPLVEALKSTIQYQRKLQTQSQMSAQQGGPVAGPVPVIPGGQTPGTMTIPLG